MKISENLFKLMLDAFAMKASFEDVAETVGVSRRVIYLWRDQSKAACAGRDPWDEPTDSEFFIRDWHGRCGMFHDLLALARSPGFKLPDDVEFEEPPPTEEEKDKAFAEQAKADKQALDTFIAERGRADLERERARAREWRARQKQIPDGPVDVFGRGEAPDCVVGPEPEPLSQMERERRHPRAHWSVNSDLRKPKQPRQVRAMPIDTAGMGDTEPPDTMRADAVRQHRYQLSERLHHGPMALRDAQGRPLK